VWVVPHSLIAESEFPKVSALEPLNEEQHGTTKSGESVSNESGSGFHIFTFLFFLVHSKLTSYTTNYTTQYIRL